MLRNVLGMLCNVLGMLRNVLSVLGMPFRKVLGVPHRRKTPSTCCLISCEVKGVVHHQVSILRKVKGAQSKSYAYAAIKPHLAEESKLNFNYVQKPISVNYDFSLLFINKQEGKIIFS